MNVFYYDSVIEKFEKELNFTPIISYLENLFQRNRDEKILAMLIGSCWYYLIEGNINKKPINYDWKLYQKKWKEYIDIGLKEFFDSEIYCYIGGYTLGLHGIYINLEYEKKGMDLMNRCYLIAQNHNLKSLAKIFIDNNELLIYLENANNICRELFPSKSLIENYFNQIYAKRLLENNDKVL